MYKVRKGKRQGINRKAKHTTRKSAKEMTVEEFEREFDKAKKMQPHVDIPKVVVVFKDKTSFLARDYKIRKSSNGTVLVDLIYTTDKMDKKPYIVTVPLDNIIDVF
jgi:hypothetical protein